ncbi:hypothetical protein CARUB_v10002749mg [Capsella rubella]|uniref:Uncharacterized protein n=1 Tax=Capsella rubella TaxID=81985 RepID=R0HEH4_9BRAS|nr:hypothetical protein CARUB_v10002749mg [Capsella rubella]
MEVLTSPSKKTHSLMIYSYLDGIYKKNAQTNWVPRSVNHVADCLAKDLLPHSCDFKFHYYVPSCLINSLHVDHLQS